jgi:hypothetical protein
MELFPVQGYSNGVGIGKLEIRASLKKIRE